MDSWWTEILAGFAALFISMPLCFIIAYLQYKSEHKKLIQQFVLKKLERDI